MMSSEMDELALIEVSKLRPHEETTEGRVRQIKKALEDTGILWFPILVDKESLTIIDGHHRTECFKRMGLRKIRARLVDYSNPGIKVETRRPEIEISKKIVVEKALAGEVFPHKTTRHKYPDQNKKINEPFENFR